MQSMQKKFQTVGAGRSAKKTGSRIKRQRGSKVYKAKVSSFSIYLRPKSKALIVEAAAVAKMPVSQFVILETLKIIVADKGKTLEALLPPDEYQALVYRKFRTK